MLLQQQQMQQQRVQLQQQQHDYSTARPLPPVAPPVENYDSEFLFVFCPCYLHPSELLHVLSCCLRHGYRHR